MAGLSVEIKVDPSVTPPNVTATASGTQIQVITDDQESQLGLTDAVLKDCVDKYFGKKPTDAYLKSPTPWGDLYVTYDWEQTTYEMTAVNAEVISVTSTPQIVDTQTLYNDSNKVATFSATMSVDVTNSMTSSWSKTTTVTMGEDIHVGCEIFGLGVAGDDTMSFEDADQKGGSTTETTTLSTGSSVTVTLNPGEKVYAHLNCSVGVAKVRVTYDMSAQGYVAANYNPTYNGHHFWALPATSVMAAGGITMGGQQQQDIEINCYSNAQVTISDKDETYFLSLGATGAGDIKNDAEVKQIPSVPRKELVMAVPLQGSPAQADK